MNTPSFRRYVSNFVWYVFLCWGISSGAQAEEVIVVTGMASGEVIWSALPLQPVADLRADEYVGSVNLEFALKILLPVKNIVCDNSLKVSEWKKIKAKIDSDDLKCASTALRRLISETERTTTRQLQLEVLCPLAYATSVPTAVLPEDAVLRLTDGDKGIDRLAVLTVRICEAQKKLPYVSKKKIDQFIAAIASAKRKEEKAERICDAWKKIILFNIEDNKCECAIKSDILTIRIPEHLDRFVQFVNCLHAAKQSTLSGRNEK